VLVAGRRSLSAFKSRFNLGERLADLVARATVDVLVANSEAVKADVVAREHVPGGRIRVIHNGVEIPAPLPPDARRRLRERWCATDDTIVIGCVANYKPHKGLEAVIRAAVAVRARAPGIRVVLVGEGKHRAALEALIAALDAPELVLLNGAEHEARDVYGAFDIAVHASEAEGLPNVVLEAAAAGLPIVATAAGGTVEIVDDGRTGRLVPIGDVPALTAALLELIEDPELRARFGASARADVAVRFGVDRMVEEFTQLYEDIAAGRPRGRFARWGSDLRHGDRTLA
jgi:glycosyltransferase involved in cell wall biosynthesis